MKSVIMINRVPLPDGKGGSYLPMEGDECIVEDDIAHALVKGGDAEITVAKSEPVAAPAATAPMKADKKSHQTKNKGAAPYNK